jgi:hypothetical protein
MHWKKNAVSEKFAPLIARNGKPCLCESPGLYFFKNTFVNKILTNILKLINSQPMN